MIEIIKKILKVFSDNGLFDEGVELIGSWCFKLYQKHLGVRSFPLRTPDINFLIPAPYLGKEHSDFIEQLERLGFSRDFRSDGSLYLWSADLKIEFIVPDKGASADKAIKIKKLGLSAIPLRFVFFLLKDSITIIEDGIKIRVPNPANFCLHKLIIASRRKNIDKSLKDLEQAICTSVILDLGEIQDSFKFLPKRWQKAILMTLENAQGKLPLLNKEIEKLRLALQTG